MVRRARSQAPFICTRLAIVLIRPSRYDDDGYVVRHWRGTLPSNTLSCLNGLTRHAIDSGALRPLAVTVHLFDESVDRVSARGIARRYRHPSTSVVVALAGVQTNQFPRARDLALEFKAQGCQVMMGGFHVSGSVAMAPTMPPECQALIEAGVTLVLGEVENHWTALLRDAAAGQLRPLYNLLGELPDLGAQPLPACSHRLQRKFAVRGYGTIDAGRGCPFACSFCTIISVQGRAMRCRRAAQILDHIRGQYGQGRRSGIRHYFFTDDNFARNPGWEAILDGLIALREVEGRAVDFMMQVDIAAARIPRLVEKAARAGCVQVFIGMESLREDNLHAAGKRQNRVATYREAIGRWHDAGIVCHVGFIIGFPHDTYQRVMEDVRALRDDLLIDQASFFMLTPLPGSRDHQLAVEAGVPLDPDYNNFDSFHTVAPHPRMSSAEWTAAYRDCWTTFYSFEQMRQTLLRQNPHTYWGMFKCFLWYRAAMVEGAHPMVTGFLRLKDRRSRRPGRPIETPVRFLYRRMVETLRLLRGYGTLVREARELWRATRIRRRDYRACGGLGSLSTRAALEIKTNWGRLHAGLRARFPPAPHPMAGTLNGAVRDRVEALWRARGGPLVARRTPVRRRWGAGNPLRVIWSGARELAGLLAFLAALAFERH